MAAPQSVKRGLRRVKGLALLKQWASLFREVMLAGVVNVRFTAWWMGERSDVGGTAMERTVEAIAVSKRRSRHGIFIIMHDCVCAQGCSVAGGIQNHCVLEIGPSRYENLCASCRILPEASLARFKTHHACLSCHPRYPHSGSTALSCYSWHQS